MTRQLGEYSTSFVRTHARFQFSTHAAAGANVAPSSAFEAADLRIYRAAEGAAYSATQRSSANGITMTSPFGSLTGVHDVDIDLTDNTDSGFYAAGYRYSVMLCPDETVDSQTITGIVLAEFDIVSVNRMMRNIAGTGIHTVVDVVNSQTELELAGGFEATTNNYQYGWALIRDASDATGQTAVWRRITSSAQGGGSNATITIASATGFGAAAGDVVELYPSANVSHIANTSQTARDIGASVLLSSGTGSGQLDFTSGVVKANTVQEDSVAYASRQNPTGNGGRMWFVNVSTGNDSNTGYTSTTAKQTYSAAETLASRGDSIYLSGGTYPAITVSKSGITVIGDYRGGVTYQEGVQTLLSGTTYIETSAAAGVTVTGHNVTLINLFAKTTLSSGAAAGLSATGIYGLTVIKGSYTGTYCGIQTYQCTNTKLMDAEFICTGQVNPGPAGFLEADRNAMISGCRFLTLASTGNGNAEGAHMYGCYDAMVTNTRFECERTNAATGYTHAVSFGGDDPVLSPTNSIEPPHVKFDNCQFRVVASHASNTGVVACIGSGQDMQSYVEVLNPRYVRTNSGSGTSYDHYAYTGSSHTVRGGNCDSTKITASTVQVVDEEVADTLAVAGDLEAGAAAVPVNQVPVPTVLTWVPIATRTGFAADSIAVDESTDGDLFCVDFRNALANNGRLKNIESVEIVSGTASGLTFGADVDDVDDYGVDRSQAKFRITPTTAGTYVIRVKANKQASDGGGTVTADVTLVVSE